MRNNRALLGVAALAVGIMIVLGWSFAPSSVSSTVSAANQENLGGASAEMLNYALNFKSASSLAVYAATVSETRAPRSVASLVRPVRSPVLPAAL